MKNNENQHNDVSIIVCCHKQDYYPKRPGFIPLHVGKAIAKEDLGIQGDNTGDSISEKNRNFCELTGHYWLWKNGPKTKYVGINHYRRYFDFNHKLPYGTNLYDTTLQEIGKNFSNLPDLDAVFSKYDIIIAKPNIHPLCGALNYKLLRISNDYDILEKVIAEKYPEYWTSYYKVMYLNNKFSSYNMFIMRHDLFDDYSKWLFDILFEVEKRISISEYPDQARVFGYMSEYLLNVFIHYHNLKAKKVPVLMIRDQLYYNSRTLEYIKNFIIAIRYNLSHLLLRPFKREKART